MLYSSILVSVLVLSMLVCILIEINEMEVGTFSNDFKVFFIKFPCAIALHFCLYPEVGKGMNIMKFANN